MSIIAHADLPLLFRRRKTMSTMRRAMIMISSKQPITIPTTSPTFRHVSEIERMVSKGGELIKIMSLELRQTRGGKEEKR